MDEKIKSLFDYIKNLRESDLDQIIHFVLGMTPEKEQLSDRLACPYCGGDHVIKYGRKDGKQRFFCKDCQKTFMHTSNTLMANSHYGRLIWTGFIRDTLYSETMDGSAERFGFSHQTAFNMRHKVLMALQDMLEKDPVSLSGMRNLMKPLYLIATRVLLFRSVQDARHVNMAQRQKKGAFQMNMSQSVPVSSVTVALLPKQ